MCWVIESANQRFSQNLIWIQYLKPFETKFPIYVFLLISSAYWSHIWRLSAALSFFWGGGFFFLTCWCSLWGVASKWLACCTMLGLFKFYTFICVCPVLHGEGCWWGVRPVWPASFCQWGHTDSAQAAVAEDGRRQAFDRWLSCILPQFVCFPELVWKLHCACSKGKQEAMLRIARFLIQQPTATGTTKQKCGMLTSWKQEFQLLSFFFFFSLSFSFLSFPILYYILYKKLLYVHIWLFKTACLQLYKHWSYDLTACMNCYRMLDCHR